MAEVNDVVTAELMLDLHERLAQDAGRADALLASRRTALGDLVAAALLALGV